MAMKLEDLHAIIDTAAISNPKTEFVVGVVDLSGDKAKVYQIDEVYLDKDEGIVSLVITAATPSGGDKEDAHV